LVPDDRFRLARQLSRDHEYSLKVLPLAAFGVVQELE